jgi:hypothetical protein
LFLFLAAVVCAVAPLPLVLRSVGILLFSYVAFATAGLPAAYLTALLAPVLGLLGGSEGWLIMLPVILASNLLAMLGLEFAWSYPALIVSPLLQITPQLVTLVLSRRELFLVELPWEPGAQGWILLHGLVAVLGVLLGLLLERKRLAAVSKGQA